MPDRPMKARMNAAMKAPLQALGLSAAFVICLLAPTGGAAADQAGIARVERLFDLIGLSVILDNAQDDIAAVARDNDFPPGPMTQWWSDAARQHFHSPRMKDETVAATSRILSAQQVEDLIEMFSSRFALMVSGLETARQTEFGPRKRKEEGEAILERLTREDPGRITGYSTIIARTNAVEDAVLQTQKMTFILLRTMMIQSGQQVDDAMLLAMLHGQEEDMRADIRAGLLARSAYTYDPLTSEEFERYLGMIETPLVMGFYEAVNAAASDVYFSEFEAFSQTLANLAEAEKL